MLHVPGLTLRVKTRAAPPPRCHTPCCRWNTSAASTWPRPPAHTRRPPGIGAQEARSASARALGAAGRRQPPPQTARLAAPTNPTAVASDPASAARDPQAPATGAATARSFRQRATKRRLFRPRTATGSGRRQAGSVAPRHHRRGEQLPPASHLEGPVTVAPVRMHRRKRKGLRRRPPHRPHGLPKSTLNYKAKLSSIYAVDIYIRFSTTQVSWRSV